MPIHELAGLLFLVGLTGSGHCIAMCGGLASALGLTIEGSTQRQLTLLLVAQLGRLLSYALIGGLFGGSLHLVQQLFDIKLLLISLQISANLMLIAMGLYIMGWWFGLKRLELLALPLWRKLQPLQQKFIPLKSGTDALVVGLCWGWLPCGLVYSALVTSVSASAHLSAALGMLAFGLGTLPSILLIGSASAAFKKGLNSRWIRVAMALLLISYGINQLIQIVKMIF